MNAKHIQTNRAVSISTRLFRGWRHMLSSAALAGAMVAASPALPMGDGLSPGLFPLPQDLGDRVLLACDTDEDGGLNGCNAEGVEYLAVPLVHASGPFWNNGLIIERDVTVQGMQNVVIVGKEKAGVSFDAVSVTVDGKQVSVEIFPGEDTSPPTCGSAVKVMSGSEFCKNVVLPKLDTGYIINGLGYVIDVDLPKAGEAGSTKIWKCTGFTHRCVPDRDNVEIKGARHTALVETPHYVGGTVGCSTC
jgi:hypothetical protein